MSDQAKPEHVPAPAVETDSEAESSSSWEKELEAGLAGIESSSAAPPEGLQPRRVILTSQNGSSLSFVRRRGTQEPKS